MFLTDSLISASDLLRTARKVAVLSGAGLSKASGIPTYRDTGGLWREGDNLRFSSLDAYKEDPRRFAAFWKKRLADMGKARPNAGHQALARLGRVREVTHVTQNVDGLLSEAGAQNVLELHGSLRRWRCSQCSRGGGPWLYGRCIRCFNYARPDVVMFGESLDPETLLRAEQASAACDVFLLVGSSALVYPAAELPVKALRFGAKLIVLNAEPLLLDHAADVVLHGDAEKLLPALLQHVDPVGRSIT